MKLKLLLLTILVIIASVSSNGQNPLNILNSPTYYVPCTDSCVKLKYNFQHGSTNSYWMNYQPYNYLTVTGMTSIPMLDDTFSNAIPMGFNFCFYGHVYSQCYISDNGVLTFNPFYALGSCNNNTQQQLPYFNSNFADAAIFFPFMDIDPTLGGTLRYKTIGIAPNRRFVVEYDNVKLFGVNCSNDISKFQLILNETSNLIEVNVQAKVICNSSPTYHANYATLGIQSIQAAQTMVAPNFNAQIWTDSNLSVQFQPIGIQNYTVNWLDSNGVLLSTQDSFLYCPQSYPKKIICKLQTSCPVRNFYDTIVLLRAFPTIDSIHTINPICANANTGAIQVFASGTLTPFSYHLSPGNIINTTGIFNNLAYGYYTVIVKNSTFCADTSILIQLIPLSNPNIFASIVQPICPNYTGGSINATINNITSPYSFWWSTGDSTLFIDSLSVGTYHLYVLDSFGCLYDKIVPISLLGLPVVWGSIVKPHCQNPTGSISLSISVNTMPYTILWNTGDTTNYIDSLFAGAYSFTVKDSNNCTSSGIIVLVDTLTILTTKSIIHTKCGLNNGSATLNPYNSVGPYHFVWDNGDTTATANNLTPGMHTCIVYSAAGCVKPDTVYINPSSVPILSLQISHANCDSSNGIMIPTTQFAQAPFSYLWSTGSTGTYVSGLAAGTYWGQLIDANGCVMHDTATLQQEGAPNLIVLNYVAPLCHGDSTGYVELSGVNGKSPYKYSVDGLGFSSVAQINFITGGNYILYIKDANGCLRDSSIFFTQPDEAFVNYTADSVACIEYDSATLRYSAWGGTGPFTYNFNHQTSFGIDTFYENLGAGTYQLFVIDAVGCIDSFNIVIPGPEDTLRVGMFKENISCTDSFSASILAAPTGGWGDYTYKWWPTGQTTNKIVGLEARQYLVTVKDKLGCTISNFAEIENEKCCEFIIPNAFSPNNDNMNDGFSVIPLSKVISADLRIYDRYGNCVFQTNDLSIKWNGVNKDKPCTMGVYFYVFQTKCAFYEEYKLLKGDITLLR